MTDSIEAITTNAASSVNKSSSSNSSTTTKLTDATKAKLQALGVDTSNIQSEMEGEIALQQAQAEQKTDKANKTASSSSEDIVKVQAETLASQVGASVSNSDTTDTILSKISDAITQLKAAAGNDQTKLAQVQNFEEAYSSISGSYTAMQSSQSKISSSMSAMASYNKIFQKIN